MTFDINLDWKSFNVNLGAVGTWLKANAGSLFAGTSGNDKFQVHFTAEPDQAIKDAVQAYWDGLSPSSQEATSYKTQAQIEADDAAAKASALASATSKLEALGLSAAEIAALLG